MISHAPRWFQLSSWLFLNRNKEIAAIFVGRPVIIMGWRREWFGPAMRLKDVDGSIISGVDPAALSDFNFRDINSDQAN